MERSAEIFVLTSAMVNLRPSSSCTSGSQLSSLRAREMFGFRCSGSSKGNGLKTNSDLDLVKRNTSFASSSIVNPVGLPIFIGPVIFGEMTNYLTVGYLKFS